MSEDHPSFAGIYTVRTRDGKSTEPNTKTMSKLKIVGKVEVPEKLPEPVWHAVCKKCGAVVEAPSSAWACFVSPFYWLQQEPRFGADCPECRNPIDAINEPAPEHLRTKPEA